MSVEAYLGRVVTVLDQDGNVIVLNGMDDETISAHAARAAAKGHEWGKVLIDVLDWIQPHHGTIAEKDALKRAEATQAAEAAALHLKGEGHDT